MTIPSPATASASADTTLAGVHAPGPAFNFAQHLLALNTGRADKAAFIDDLGSLSYGELATQVRQLASGLLGLGLRREERVPAKYAQAWPIAQRSVPREIDASRQFGTHSWQTVRQEI